MEIKEEILVHKLAVCWIFIIALNIFSKAIIVKT